MLELHVWGYNLEISPICPESLASSWLLKLQLTPQNVSFKIVTSSNTNVSDIDKLPVLIVNKNEKYQGYANISRFISRNYSTASAEFLPDETLNKRQRLINNSLAHFIDSKIDYINQYNLYINTENYEKYTRKLFQNFFPFPMMYNQPLKFYNSAQVQVREIGLTGGKHGFFSFSGSDKPSSQTEYFNDEIDHDYEEQDKVAISGLHEKQLLTKSKEKNIMKESRNSLKCLNLINEYIGHIIKLYKQLNSESSSFGFFFNDHKISSSELLLYSYMNSLTYSDLSDKFISNYLRIEHPDFINYIATKISTLNHSLYQDKSIFRGPTGIEIPSLWNEIKYVTGLVKY